jgi:APA family basic amino acid/polyamine antiporter
MGPIRFSHFTDRPSALIIKPHEEVEQVRKKLSVPALAGLLVGPVLGSGVILLPPLALKGAGSWSFAAWAVTMLLMGIFAAVTAALSLRFPGDGGLTEAVGNAFGPGLRDVCGWLLAGAVCFGPAAVMLTAGEYLAEVLPVPGGGAGWAAVLTVLAAWLLQRRAAFVGTLALWASTLIGAVLLLGSLFVLLHPTAAVPLRAPTPRTFGTTLMLLFWAVIGWEILGNYTREIEAPERTIPRAAILGFAAVAAVELSIAAALPQSPATGGAILPSMTDLLRPLFGTAAAPLLVLLGTLLCLCTYLMVVGGVARLVASLAERGRLPRTLASRNREGVPGRAAFALGTIHIAGIGAAALGLLDVADLVGTANGLFLLNALLVVLAGAKLLQGRAARVGSGLLAAGFLVLFSLADRISLLAVVTALLLSIWGQKEPLLPPRCDSEETEESGGAETAGAVPPRPETAICR